MTIPLPSRVTIIEVGPRDGLQNEKVFIDTAIKKAFIQKLKKAGITDIELTSFVSPKWVPQMSDAMEIVSDCLEPDHAHYVLAPNRFGIEKVQSTSCKHIALFVGASDTFNQKNINKSTDGALSELLPLISLLKKDRFFIRVCISTAFYCPFEGKTPEEKVLSLCQSFASAGIDELSVADTIGMAAPHESFSLFSKLLEAFPDTLITAHFHNTRGLALTNIYAALQAGITRFDTAAGGLGGCPFAPGASGNVATEDVVYMLERMGIHTGIDPFKVVEAVQLLAPLIHKEWSSVFYRQQVNGERYMD